jgi:hypothetical protein
VTCLHGVGKAAGVGHSLCFMLCMQHQVICPMKKTLAWMHDCSVEESEVAGLVTHDSNAISVSLPITWCDRTEDSTLQ